MIIVVVSYLRVMDSSLSDPHQSTESPKRKLQHPACVPNVVKLDTQGGHVVILIAISIPII